MKLSSSMALKPLCLFFVLGFVVLLIPALVIANWCSTTKRIENAVTSESHYVQKEALADIATAIRLLFPINKSALHLARTLHSSLNSTRPSLSTMQSMVAPHLFLALKTLVLSQVSYIGLDGSIYSYYIDGNQTFLSYSNLTNIQNTSTFRNVSLFGENLNAILLYNYSTQAVDGDIGKQYNKEKSTSSLISIDSRWLQNALWNSSKGYASLGRGWGKTQELLFLTCVSINGFGAVSLGLPVKAIKVAISTINLHGGELYMATEDGMILAQTGKHSVKVNNGIVSIFAGNFSDAQTSVNISCEPNESPLRKKSVDIGGTKYMIYCAPLDIVGLPSVAIMVHPMKGLVGEIQRHSKITLVLLIALLIFLVITISSFIFFVIKTARREMFLCAALIKQMEATQQAERKSMNKSLAFASASHDVRSSLASLDGIITLCSAEVSPNSEIFSNLENMRNLTADLVALLNSVLDTSKIEAGKMQLNEQDFSLAQVLEETVNLYYPVAKEKGIDLVLDPCDGSIVMHSPVKGDRGKLKQVLSNLLHNAIKFTSDGNIVVRCWVNNPVPDNSILASKSYGGWHYLLRFLRKNNGSYSGDLRSLQTAQQHQNCDEFVIEVDDTGRGIPKEKQKSVFEDFVQVKETAFEHGGTGLGLGIVQSL
ncbi:Histidine kinase, partial [Thalictrum thalictroides]